MAELNCKIESDFSLRQVDCHWELERFFRLTWDKADGKYLYYGLGNSASHSVNTNKVYEEGNSYVYELPLSAFTTAQLVSARDSGGWISLTVSCNGKQKTFNKFYLLELPPVFDSNTIKYDLVVDNPGEIKVSWEPADELDRSDAENSPDSLDGYSIEVFHCPANLDATVAENFTRLDGLQWKDADPETGMPTTGVYKLTRVPVNIEITTPEVLEGEEEISSYANLNPSGEVYIENPLKTEFFFNPKHLDIKPGDSYKFVIYPYSHYEGSLISSQGVESSVKKVLRGFVQVKTASGWEAGQVWVYTTNGWVPSEAVYVATAGETEGTIIWKQAW